MARAAAGAHAGERVAEAQKVTEGQRAARAGRAAAAEAARAAGPAAPPAAVARAAAMAVAEAGRTRHAARAVEHAAAAGERWREQAGRDAGDRRCARRAARGPRREHRARRAGARGGDRGGAAPPTARRARGHVARREAGAHDRQIEAAAAEDWMAIARRLVTRQHEAQKGHALAARATVRGAKPPAGLV